MRALVAVAALLALTASASAEEQPRSWTASVRPAYVFMGDKRSTGGLMPRIEALRAWPVGSGVALSVGAGIGAFGFGEPDALRWLGVLGGPIVAASGRPWAAPIEARAAIHLDGGRVPTCNNWGLCLLYSGFYPGLEGSLAWTPSPSVSLGASFLTRRVATLGWSGFSVEPAVVGRWSF